MNDLLQRIDDKREAILLGEIGALLHMFGKCSSEFLKASSKEAEGEDSHQDLRHLPELESRLANQKLCDAFSFMIDGDPQTLRDSFTDFIRKYKRNPTGLRPDCLLLHLFNRCHRTTSADEKGVVRQTQSKDDMWIASPLGREVERITLDGVDKARMEMDRRLTEAFDGYLSGGSDIAHLRQQVITILQPGFSHALGDTRRPGNDVTLWDQSRGVASLYKPALATLALGFAPCPMKPNGDPDTNRVTWRLFGVGWNGLGFLHQGRKPSDILSRANALDSIIADLRTLLEVTHPVGNRFYADLNGLFFTFPGIEDDGAARLTEELAPEVARIVRERSDAELWPFFTLCRPRRTLTAITGEIAARDRMATEAKSAPTLSIEGTGVERHGRLLVPCPDLPPVIIGHDICPVCQLRSKAALDEACVTCAGRRASRQTSWQRGRDGQTIWVDEAADPNNRVALLTIKIDLSRWLSGEWLTTIWSQTYDQWAKGARLATPDGQVVGRLRQLVDKREILLPDGEPSRSAKSLATWVLAHSNRTERKPLLESFLGESGGVYAVEEIDDVLAEIAQVYGTLDEERLLTSYFTQNASPARLARIWGETNDFLRNWIACLRTAVFAPPPRRLGFATQSRVPGATARRTYRVTVSQLAPGPITVLCLDSEGRTFLTIDSLEKFWFREGPDRSRGVVAVQEALQLNGVASILDQDSGARLPVPDHPFRVDQNHFHIEPYLPFIVLARSPVYCQVLVPAARVQDVLRQLLDLADERFGRVEGKLPLHVGVLVSQRRFPLYALIEAGQQMLDHPSLQEGRLQAPWWDTTKHAADPFYDSYPTSPPEGRGFRLGDLSPVDCLKEFWLTPGYFDVDFLASTADRHRLGYDLDGDGRPVRPAIAYGYLRPRPLPLHRLRRLLQLWEVLSRLGPTQRHQLEAALATKLEEWKSVGDEARPVYQGFARAVLRDVFKGNPDHSELLERSAQDGLLLDCLELFQHVLKEEPPHG